MPTTLTNALTGLDLRDGLYPRIPAADDPAAAGLLFGFTYPNVQLLIRNLELVSHMYASTAPASFAHTQQLKTTIAGAFFQWHSSFPD